MIVSAKIIVILVSLWGLTGFTPNACAQAEPKSVTAVGKSVGEPSDRKPLAAVTSEDFDKKVIEYENRLLDVRIANMNFWFTFLTIFLAVLAVLIGFLAWWVPRTERKQLTEKLLEARDTLAQAKEHLRQAQDASEKAAAAASEADALAKDTKRASDQAHADAKEIETLRTQQVDKPLTVETQKVAEKVATDDSVSTPDSLRAQALLAQQRKDWLAACDLWQALTHLDDKSASAHFGVAYCLQMAVDEKLIPAGDGIYQRVQDNYAEATRLDVTNSSSFNNWGNALFAQAKTKQGEDADRLFAAALEKYAKAVELDPKDSSAFNNWGAVLSAQAKTKQGEDADRLFAAAYEKYAKAVELDPKNSGAFYNWGTTLFAQAKTKQGEDADRLFAAAFEKYAKAVELDPKDSAAFNNWGTTLSAHAQTKQGEDRTRLFREAERVLSLSKVITEKGTYNLACVYALTGSLEKCRSELEQCLADGTLPGANHMRKDKDLEGVRNEAWFTDLVSRAKH